MVQKKPATKKQPIKKPAAQAATPKAAPALPESKFEVLSISALSKKFLVDRTTVANRLEKQNVPIIQRRGNEKLYELTEEVRRLLDKDDKETAQIYKLQLEGQILEEKLARERGEYFHKAEVTTIFLTMFGKMQKMIAVEYPNRAGKTSF
jgi:hypothetical protein